MAKRDDLIAEFIALATELAALNPKRFRAYANELKQQAERKRRAT